MEGNKQQERDLKAQKCELEKLQAEKDLRVAQARFEAYNRIAVQEVDNPATNYIVREQHRLPLSSFSQPGSKLLFSLSK